jgi:hypothetical protein
MFRCFTTKAPSDHLKRAKMMCKNERKRKIFDCSPRVRKRIFGKKKRTKNKIQFGISQIQNLGWFLYVPFLPSFLSLSNTTTLFLLFGGRVLGVPSQQ